MPFMSTAVWFNNAEFNNDLPFFPRHFVVVVVPGGEWEENRTGNGRGFENENHYYLHFRHLIWTCIVGGRRRKNRKETTNWICMEKFWSDWLFESSYRLLNQIAHGIMRRIGIMTLPSPYHHSSRDWLLRKRKCSSFVLFYLLDSLSVYQSHPPSILIGSFEDEAIWMHFITIILFNIHLISISATPWERILLSESLPRDRNSF